MKNKISLYIALFIICIICCSCSPNIDNNEIVENYDEIIEYEFMDSLDEEMIQGFTEINEKYSGIIIESMIVENVDIGEQIDIAQIEGPKIIELYSSFCSACLTNAPIVDEFIKANKESISYFTCSKIKSSVQTENMRNVGFNEDLYFFVGDLHPVVSKAFNVARPAYILIDENNRFIVATSGPVGADTCDILFSPFKDFINLEGVQDGDNMDCQAC